MSVALTRPRELARGRRGAAARRAQLLLAAAFVLPAALVYGFFMVYPFVGSIWLSLTDWDGFSPAQEFVGLDNYLQMLTDGQMWHALGNNAIWAVVGTAAPIVLGLPLAIILWSGVRFRLFFRAVYFLPFILPLVVVGTIWGWIYHPIFGVLNSALSAVGLDGLRTGWLGNPDTALWAVLATAVWGYFGFVVVVFLAGLQNVNIDLIDAARIDGASPFQRARHIILPQIAPVVTMVTTVTLIGAFSVFDIVYVLTKGGPGNATEVLALYTYEKAFEESSFGFGAAASIVMAALSLVFAYAFVRYRERADRGV